MLYGVTSLLGVGGWWYGVSVVCGWVFGKQTTANSYDTPRCVQLMSRDGYYIVWPMAPPDITNVNVIVSRPRLWPVCLLICLIVGSRLRSGSAFNLINSTAHLIRLSPRIPGCTNLHGKNTCCSLVVFYFLFGG